MKIMSDFLKHNRRMVLLMSVPVSLLLALFVIRFIRMHSIDRATGVAAFHPDNKIVLENKSKSNLDQIQSDLNTEQKTAQQKQKSLVSLDFQHIKSNILKDSVKLSPAVGIKKFGESRGRSAAGSLEGNRQRVIHKEESRLSQLGSRVESYPHIAHEREKGRGQSQRFEMEETGPISFNAFSKAESKTDASQKETEAVEVKALVLGDQQIADGARVKFRTSEEVSISKKTIPRNTTFIASAHFESGRLMLLVHHMGTGANQITVNMMGLDEDNKPGLRYSRREKNWSEPLEVGKNEVINQVSSASPIGSGMISQVGRKLFHSNKEKPLVLTDGLEISFTAN